MTLHWWMHWFWVTTLLTLLDCCSIIVAAPQSERSELMPTHEKVEPRHSERQGRAMYIPKPSQITTRVTPAPIAFNLTQTNQTGKVAAISGKTTIVNNTTRITNASLVIVHPSLIWTLVNSTEATNMTKVNNTNINVENDTNEDVTLIQNKNLTEIHNTTVPDEKLNLTKPDVLKEDTNVESLTESRIVTEKPLSLETSFLQTRIPPNIESSRRVIDPGDTGMDTGAIAGISFAALVLAALAGSTAFVLYRRRYLNKPQTLNDKCSNPDSSGYLDDSTVRDNSEEMYSLDNDSFLNSLEAMTIQNYWTDTVKHTKL